MRSKGARWSRRRVARTLELLGLGKGGIRDSCIYMWARVTTGAPHHIHDVMVRSQYDIAIQNTVWDGASYAATDIGMVFWG